MIVIEMVVDEQDDREVYKVEKMVTKEWTKANSSDTGFFEFQTQSLVLVIRHVFHFTSIAMDDDLSYGLNTLGPLCLWFSESGFHEFQKYELIVCMQSCVVCIMQIASKSRPIYFVT